MKFIKIRNLLLLGVASMLAAPLAAVGQTTVFQDTFGSSTLNPTAASPGTLNSTTTAYEIAGSKNSTSTSIASGALTLSSVATSSGYTEAQALFTATPITLNAAGQYIELYSTFTDTANLFNGNANNGMYLVLGMYNSGGSAPTNGTLLWNGGMVNTQTTATNGACKGWLGYTAMFAFSSNSVQSSAIGSRPAQTGVNNLVQGLGYGSGYSSGANVTTKPGVVGQPLLTVGNQYTMHLRISYVNATTIAITNTLYNGAGIGGPVFSAGGWTGQFGSQTASPLTMTFDGLQVGFRPNGSIAMTMQVNSLTAVKYIPATPNISGLTNQTIIQGSNATLSASVTGTPTPGLQWYVSNDGGVSSNAVPGETSSSLTLNNVQYSQDGYIYYLLATNSQGTASSSMTLSVNVPPSISGLSSTASASPGSTVTFSPTVSGSPAPVLQWQINGVNLADGTTGNGSIIAGSQTSTLNITNAQVADSATYSLIASNSAGSVTNNVTLTVSSGDVLPSFAGPVNQTNIQGSTATFTVTSVSGVPAPTLQWLDQTQTPILGETGTSLVLPNVQFSQDGYTYYLVASNSVGMVTNGATLTVIVPPSISVQPTNLVVTNTQSVAFSVAATGVPAPTYQWYKNSSPILSSANPSATNATLVIASAAPGDAASYYVQISNSAGTTNSTTVTLTVNSAMFAAALSPANGTTGVCYDTPLYLTFSQPPALQKVGAIKIFNVNNSTTPVDTINLSQSIDRSTYASFTNNAYNIQSRTISGDTFTNFPVIITGNTTAIYPHLGVLTSNQTYYVTVDNGTFTDAAGANFAGITATNVWKFTTKAGGPANPVSLVVAQDYSGDFATVQGAVDFVPSGNTTPTLITIKNGDYVEIVNIKSRHNLTLRGQSRSGTVVGYANNANLQGSTHSRMAMKINANDIALDNLTLTNRTPLGGSQAEALLLESNAKRFIFNNCNLGSYQDTLLANGGGQSQSYFNNSLVTGQFDYLWGGGVCFFTNCELRTLPGVNGSGSGNLTAVRTENQATGNWAGYSGLSSSNGFSFVCCRLTGAAGVNNVTLAGSNGTTNAVVAWINCLIDTNVYKTPAVGVLNSQLLWEYGNSNLLGTAPATFGLAALTTSDARYLAASSSTNWLYGWQPALAPNIISQPAGQSVSHGQPANFAVSATGIPDPGYQWFQNGSPIAGATNATLAIAGAVRTNGGNYSVVVNNGSGSVTSSVAVLTYNNTAPVAQTMTATRQAGFSLKISLSDLSTNWSDTDGDSVSLTGINWATTNGAALTPINVTTNLDGSYVITNTAFLGYSNSNNVADRFSYTIADGFGGTATGYVNILVSTNSVFGQSNPQITSINGGLQVQVTFYGVPGYTYVAQRNLVDVGTPAAWLDFSTNAATTSNPAIIITDVAYPQAFYRLKWQP